MPVFTQLQAPLSVPGWDYYFGRGTHVSGLINGGFVTTWFDNLNNVFSFHSQLFDSSGNPMSRVDGLSPTMELYSGIAPLSSGGFVFTWETGLNPETMRDVYAQVYGPDGAVLIPSFRVNTSELSNQDTPAVAGLPNGGSIIVWEDLGGATGDPSRNGVTAQLFGADGRPVGTEFRVNTTTAGEQGDPVVAALPNGNIAVAWLDSGLFGSTISSISLQIIDGNGSLIGQEVSVTSTSYAWQPQIAVLSDSRFLMTWTQQNSTLGDASSGAIHAQVFNLDGSKSGSEFLVNTGTDGNQSSSQVTVLRDGRYLISWHDSTDNATKAQFFDAQGNRTGGEVVLSTEFGLGDSTVLADGRIAVLYDSAGALKCQILDPRVAEVNFAGTRHSDDFVGTIWDDDLRGQDGDDRLVGGRGSDRLLGDSGNDKLLGEAGRDLIEGGTGDDVLDGGSGADWLIGGSGNDTYVLSSGADTIIESQQGGSDWLTSDNHSINLSRYVNIENAQLSGALALNLTGSSGDNILYGNDGINMIRGGSGRDLLFGGLGSDVFRIAPGDSVVGSRRDVIGDFSSGDVIDLTSMVSRAMKASGAIFELIGTAPFHGVEGEIRIKLFDRAGTEKDRTLLEGDTDGDGHADFQIMLLGLHRLQAVDLGVS